MEEDHINKQTKINRIMKKDILQKGNLYCNKDHITPKSQALVLKQISKAELLNLITECRVPDPAFPQLYVLLVMAQWTLKLTTF